MKFSIAVYSCIFFLITKSIVIAQTFVPTIQTVDVGKYVGGGTYRISMPSNRYVPFILINNVILFAGGINELNRCLQLIKWNTSDVDASSEQSGALMSVTKQQLYRTDEVDAVMIEKKIWLKLLDKSKTVIVSLPLPWGPDQTGSAATLEDEFCVSGTSTAALDYAKLKYYLRTHTVPCPTQTRGQWAKAQFYIIGKRIEDLHKYRPQQAAELMREYNQRLEPYIVNEAYTGFKDNGDFDKCINFMYSVELAINKIKQGN